MNRRMIIAALASAVMATPLAAQTAPAVRVTTPPPAATVAPADPARQATATRVAGRLLPPGTYKSIMKASMAQLSNGMLDQMMDMPLGSFAGIGGLTEEQVARLGPATTRQVMAIIDPAFDERTRLTVSALGDMMGQLMDEMEPEIRVGLAQALASRFTIEQLTALDEFFATPTGAAYAGQSMAIYADPAVMQRMQGMMPRMLQQMPEWIKRMEQATAGLPKPKTPAELTPTERAKLKALMRDDPAATA